MISGLDILPPIHCKGRTRVAEFTCSPIFGLEILLIRGDILRPLMRFCILSKGSTVSSSGAGSAGGYFMKKLFC